MRQMTQKDFKIVILGNNLCIKYIHTKKNILALDCGYSFDGKSRSTLQTDKIVQTLCQVT